MTKDSKKKNKSTAMLGIVSDLDKLFSLGEKIIKDAVDLFIPEKTAE